MRLQEEKGNSQNNFTTLDVCALRASYSTMTGNLTFDVLFDEWDFVHELDVIASYC